MTRRYAEETTVPVAKSRDEIETLLMKHGCRKFASGYGDGEAYVLFDMMNRRIKFVIPLPDPHDKEFWFSSRGRRTNEQASKLWEQACRQRWRALKMVIMAKLEAVQGGITTFEEEFLAHIVMKNGETVWEQLSGRINDPAYLLEGPK